MSIKDDYQVRSVPKEQTYEWLLKKHYAKKIPSIVFSFGLYNKELLPVGFCTYGVPPSAPLVEHLLSGYYKENILELNRLVVIDGLQRNVLSFFVSQTLKILPNPLCLVSYADPNNGHHGYIYQATNWIYTGTGSETPNFYLVQGGKQIHSKWVKKYKDEGYEIRSEFQEAKHRYIYFIGDKKTKKDMLSKLKYSICEYPKGDNSYYDASYKPAVQGSLF
jgi:hypothetical protein